MQSLKRRSGPSASEELQRRRRARNSYIEYAKAIDIPGVPSDDDPDDWLIKPIETQVAKHHFLIVDAADRLIHNKLVCDQGEADGLMVLAPPGSAKSTYCDVVIPTAAMGEFPGYQVVMASYGGKIIWKHSRRARQVAASLKYRSIWGTGLSSDSAAVDTWELDNGSQLIAGGILSGIGGQRCDLLITDDPLSGRDDAESETIREKTWEEYNDVLVMRMKPRGKQLMITTRWHEEDLAGKILPEDWHGESGFMMCRDGRLWFVLCLQAECKSKSDPLGRKIGEFIWPEWFGERHFRVFRDNPTRQRAWNSLMQQVPTAEDGTFFRRHWFKRHRDVPSNLTHYISLDSAETPDGGDKTWILVWGVKDFQIYLVDIYCDQVDTAEWVDHLVGNKEVRGQNDAEIIGLVKLYNAVAIIPEADNIWGAVAPFVRRRLDEEHLFILVEPQPHGGKNKATRATSFQGLAASGRVSIPENHPEVEEWLKWHMKFPTGSEDDAVDASSAFGRYINKVWADDDDAPESDEEAEKKVNPEEGKVEFSFDELFEQKVKEW